MTRDLSGAGQLQQPVDLGQHVTRLLLDAARRIVAHLARQGDHGPESGYSTIRLIR